MTLGSSFTSNGRPAQAREAAHQPRRRLADQDRPRRRELLEARREIGGVADRGVVHLQVVADRADHHRPGIETDARRQGDAALALQLLVEVGQRVADPQRREHRPLRRVLVRDRRAEERHEAVAGELIDDPLEPVDLVHREGDVLVEYLAVDLRIEAARDRGRSGEIAEQYGYLLALARHALRVADLLRERFRHAARHRRFGRVAGEGLSAVGTEAEAEIHFGAAVGAGLRRAGSARVAEGFSREQRRAAGPTAHGGELPRDRRGSQAGAANSFTTEVHRDHRELTSGGRGWHTSVMDALQALLDRTAIHDLIMRYARGVDRRDLDLVASCFATDAAYEGSLGTGGIDVVLATLANGCRATGPPCTSSPTR
jgi:hypothetical protein